MASTANRACAAACCLFLLLGVLLIPFAGLQNDEALFAAPLLPVPGADPPAHFWQHWPPVMVMTYLGSVKAYLYWPILSGFGTGIWSVRLPVVLLGALTIFVFFQLTKSAVGPLAAGIGALLLATDPTFLLTNTFDWGPVAIEHLLLVSACWFLFQFGARNGAESRIWPLAAGCFCLGLALWNKAIFSWALTGLLVAGSVVFWRPIRRLFTVRRAGLAAAAFLVGALPLVVYNLRHDWVTFGENTHMNPSLVIPKWVQMKSALNGSSLLGYLAASDAMPEPKQPVSAAGSVAAWVHGWAGTHTSSNFYWALGLLLLAAPLWWRSRAAWFALVFTAVAWVLMALTEGAGASAHHVVLLWPFPILFASVALSAIPWRTVSIAAAGLLAGMNLLVVNQHFYQFAVYGAGDTFTDAILPLSDSLDPVDGQTVYVADWGLFDSLNLLHQGRLRLRMATGPLQADPLGEAQRAEIRAAFADPDGLWLGHAEGHEIFAGVWQRLNDLAQELGYRKEVVRIVEDSNGRPMFEVFRIKPLEGTEPAVAGVAF